MVNDSLESALDSEDIEEEIEDEVEKVLSEVAGETTAQLPNTAMRKERIKQTERKEKATMEMEVGTSIKKIKTGKKT